MLDDLRRVLASEPGVAYALVFDSVARDTLRPDGEVEVAIELRAGATRDVLTLGTLAAGLASAVGRRVDLVLLDEAPPPLAYRVFRDGRIVVEHDHAALVRRKAGVILDYLDFKPIEDLYANRSSVVDRALLATKIATVRDAVARVRAVLPPDASAFKDDRTAREIVILNLFVALQACLDLAAHWLADEGGDLPQRYPDFFVALAEHGVLPRDLATRLAAASGLRNLVAHQYGVLDWARIHAIASFELQDLERFCAELATRGA